MKQTYPTNTEGINENPPVSPFTKGGIVIKGGYK